LLFWFMNINQDSWIFQSSVLCLFLLFFWSNFIQIKGHPSSHCPIGL
jgi:hypothetical protein